tara:strand:- start:149 stop:577 length:429 start_codon:yes stop_codon:yes gene_type:complete
MRTSSAALSQADGICTAVFHGVITPSDLHSFLVQLPERVKTANFMLTDYRKVVTDFTSADLFDPANKDYPGSIDPTPFMFGAMLGRPDQMALLNSFQGYQANVAGVLRRAFTDQVECEEWAVKMSRFFDEEEADSRQERLFI